MRWFWPPMPSPPYGGKGPPLGFSQRRVLSRHKNFKSSSLGFPYPTALHPGAIPSEISCLINTCVSLGNSFPSVRQELSFELCKGFPFLQQMATLGESSSLRLTSWTLGVLRDQLACQWARGSGHNWDPFCPWSPPDADNWPECPNW